MVSVYPNPPPDQDFSNFYGFHTGGDPMKLPGVNRNDSNLLTAAGNVASGVDDPNKKIRKPYTITKSRESWSEQEHDKFLEALHLFDRDWKKIEAFVGSKTVIQIRSHAQKYFLKVQKNGTSEHVPPPRPKRKAAHPYPQKAPKSVASPATGTSQSLATVPETGYALGADPLLVCRNQMAGSPSPWTYNVATTGPSAHIQKDIEFANAATNYSSSNESTPRMWTSNEAKRGLKQQSNCARVIPDFAQVYRFIGSVFDPSARNHLQRLKEMDPINIETAVMLMKNLSINLVSPEFEDHQKLLTSYNSGGIENNSSRGSAITSV